MKHGVEVVLLIARPAAGRRDRDDVARSAGDYTPGEFRIQRLDVALTAGVSRRGEEAGAETPGAPVQPASRMKSKQAPSLVRWSLRNFFASVATASSRSSRVLEAHAERRGEGARSKPGCSHGIASSIGILASRRPNCTGDPSGLGGRMEPTVSPDPNAGIVGRNCRAEMGDSWDACPATTLRAGRMAVK